MRLYNITDLPNPKQEKAEPQTLRKAGVIIEPGGFFDVPKGFRLGTISGWIHSGLVVVSECPHWYSEAKKAAHIEKARVPPRKPVPVPEPEEKKVEVDVGAMTATVKAGPDGELGTDDDIKSIRPNRKKGKRK